MGGKESKQSFITYDEAVKRVSDNELKRLKDAFKRSSTLSGYMTKPVFIREVLGDGVPPRLAELIFETFGGTAKGLTLKDLICGLVLMTRGRQEEKLKFLFGLYSNESLTHVQKEEMDNLVLATEGQVPQALSQLFLENDRISYEYFRSWILIHPEATSVSKWFLKEPCTVTLTDDSDTPTFYQTLAGVTHLEEGEIIELEKRYWLLKAQSKTGRFDLDTFQAVVCPPIPEQLCEGVFLAFDENRDNHIDFKEMACGISACCKGPRTERQKFCFKIFDQDHDGLLSRNEVLAMVKAMILVRQENCHPPTEESAKALSEPELIASNIMKDHDSDKDGFITQEEYLVWTVNEPLPEDFLSLLFQVCHVALGLKPQSREDEGQVIIGWLERENKRGQQPGQTWYLVAMQWWRTWLEYIYYDPHVSLQDILPDLPNGRPEASKRSLSGRSLCKNLGRRTIANGIEDDSVVMTAASTIESSPVRYHTLPRVAPSTHVRRGSGTQSDCGYSPSHSNRSTPLSSPKLNKRTINQPGPPPKPAGIDNTPLITTNSSKVPVLTNEGGQLKKNVMLSRGRDFELLPEPVWKALSSWYGGSPALPRNVIVTSTDDATPQLELYPIHVRLLRHQMPPQRPQQQSNPSFTSMLGGMGAYALNATGIAPGHPPIPRRYIAYSASFSRQHTLKQVVEFLLGRLRFNREDMRLWKYDDENNMTLLEDEEQTMEVLGIRDEQQLLIEVRNKDLTWPEEMSQLAKNRAILEKKQQGPTEQGATGLNNLGNTCFMNSAVQCVSNTSVLTFYFNGGLHLYELNRDNPLGMKGHIAQCYGELVKDLWSGKVRSIAPLKLRWTIGKYAPRFNGFQQHDSQELLAFLLDGLHEDLNRVHDKPYVELKDSAGRPDTVVATEAWDNHLRRNQSVVVDLFHGQLKSCLRCLTCAHTSVRFDPFTYLSLPLPMESCIHIEVIVAKLDGGTPMRYGLRLNIDEKYRGLKRELSKLSGIPEPQIILVEICGALVKSFPMDTQKVKNLLGGVLFAYELMPLEIPPMTAAEERGLTVLSNKSQGGLAQIQRMRTNSKSNLPPIYGTDENNPSAESTVTNSPQKTPQKDKSRPESHQATPQHKAAANQTSLCNGPANGKVPNGSVSSGSGVTNQGQGQEQDQDATHNRVPSSTSINYDSISSGDRFDGFLVAVHRKMIRMDQYFLSSQKSRPSLFGVPLILPCEEFTKHQDLYQAVWVQVSRLVSPLPPSESGSHNHAQDCDDSLGYEYPFTLKVVQKDGVTCAWCPWYRFCRGCKLECSGDNFNFGSAFIAVDWEPTALHLRYQASHERLYEDHKSVEESRQLQTEPIDLDACLRAFTKEEELGEDELWYCSKCKEHRLAVKKLEIWKLPPILIIHLKRFQFLNGRWVKSQKIVKFPKKNFDPSNYFALRTQNALTSQEPTNQEPHANEQGSECKTANQNSDRGEPVGGKVESNKSKEVSTVTGEEKSNPGSEQKTNPGSKAERNAEVGSEGQGSSSTSTQHNGSGDNPSVSCQDQKYDNYDLYAMSCHTGILGGGHYVSYAKNPNRKWYCYNDSSCKEVPEEQIDTDSAYILFYERQDLEYGQFMPDISGKEPDNTETDDEFENDFRRVCVIQ